MSEVNYRRNGMNPPSRLRRLRRARYSTTGKCYGMAPKAGGFASDPPSQGYGGQVLPVKGPKPKSSRERRAAQKGKGVKT